MKKLIFTLLLSLVSMATFAQQNVYARMFGIIAGNVKSIVVETTGEVFNFDREGRLTSYSMGSDELRYSWNGNKITLAAYQNGNKLGEEYMTVTKNTPLEIAISLPGGTVTETYRSVGGEAKAVMTSNGVSMTETCYYHSDSDKYPYKFTVSMQGQTEIFEVSHQLDSHGNWIKQTVKNNGNTETNIRTITYFN